MSSKTWLVGAIVLAMGFIACGSSEEASSGDEKTADWAAVQQEHDALMELRATVAQTRAEIAAGPEGDEATGLSPEEALLQLQAKAEEQQDAVNAAADAFNTTLVEFINKYAGFVGEEIDEVQAAAIRLKSDEDIALAREYVEKGGDYKRAIDILTNALIPDPDYQALEENRARYEQLRFMDQERFSQVEKGMTEDEVRAVLGQVFHGNIRDYPERDITAWFYTRPEGAAAAVYFREQRGQLRVYDMNFDAVKTAVERAEEGE